jgi:hypothetical protein
MKTALLIAGACVALLSALKAAVGSVLQEEDETRLGRIPLALIRLASARLPRELRDDLAAEWRAELYHVLHGREGRPLTRLLRGIRYSAGLVISAPAIADGLNGDARRLQRAARIVGAGGAAGYAVWLLIYTWDFFHPPAALVHGWGPQLQPAADQLTGIGYLCFAAGFLGTAVFLVAGRWLIVDLNTAFFVAAGVLLYMGGGPLYSIVVAAVIFCVLAMTIRIQLRNRRRKHTAARAAQAA